MDEGKRLSKRARDRLRSFQNDLDRRSFHASDIETLMLLKQEVLKWSNIEESEARQKSRVLWFKEGDWNIVFFHRTVKQRHNINKILTITDSSGMTQPDPKGAEDAIISYYRNLLGCPIPYYSPPIIAIQTTNPVSEEGKDEIGRDITRDEIKKSLFNINKDKSPGPNGFNGHFFRTSWNIVGQEITNAILEFFELGQLLKSINATYLALIHICPNLQLVKDYIPISCFNLLYKVISKILAERIKGVMPRLIDKAQLAFVAGRSISDNIFLAKNF